MEVVPAQLSLDDAVVAGAAAEVDGQCDQDQDQKEAFDIEEEVEKLMDEDDAAARGAAASSSSSDAALAPGAGSQQLP